MFLLTNTTTEPKKKAITCASAALKGFTSQDICVFKKATMDFSDPQQSF